ncbi:hypothetical protein [Oceanobacillus sp. CAU 1775]
MFKSVVFYTNKLKAMRRFYANVLGLDIIEATDEKFTVKIGDTNLMFKASEEAASYHYAINIPGNQFSIMKHWIQERTKLLTFRGKTEVFHRNLAADSMYFEDPAGNLVELIGRRNRDLLGDLTKEAFYDVSEIGITTSHMEEVGDELQDLGLPLQQGAEVDVESLNYIGRDDHFVVLVPPAWEWEFSSKKSEAHPLEFTLTDGQHVSIDKNGEIQITEE